MSSTTQTVSISDTNGNSYAEAAAQTQTADGHQTRLFYAKNIAGGANTVTAAFSGTNGHPWLAIAEYSGLSTAAPLDTSAHAAGSSSSPSSGAAPATSTANELVVGGLGLPSSTSATVTAGSGYALVAQDSTTGASRAAFEERIVSASAAYAGTFVLSASANWSAVVATFK
jgi:hypothetical protein